MIDMADGDDEIETRRDVTPRPDPTRLSTAQVVREIGALRALLEARLDAMDHDRGLIRRGLDQVPAKIAQAILELRCLQEEKFNSIEIQLTAHARANDIQLAAHTKANDTTEANSRDAIEKAFLASEKAVQAALAAAEKAVSEQNRAFVTATSKSEASTAKQLDAIDAMISATVAALNDKIDDIKGRLTTIEGSGKGSKDLMAIIFTIAGILVAAIAAFIAFSKAG